MIKSYKTNWGKREMDFMIWLCCALIIAGAAVEYFTRKLIAVWVIPASVTAIALCLSEVELVFQLVALVGITLLGIALSYLFIILLLRQLLHL